MARFKLFWDYYGGDAAGTAAHFHHHLDDFLAREGLPGETGVATEAATHAYAWYVGEIEEAELVLKALKPRRAEPMPDGPAADSP